MTPKPDDRSTLVDPRVADAWREASNEEPSAPIDDAILAAARREVSARPETLAAWEAREVRASRRRWWPLAAAATIAAIAVGVLQLAPPDKVAGPATESATVSDMPSPAAKPGAGTAAPAPEPAAPPSRKEKSARSDAAGPKGETQNGEAQPRAAPAAASTAPGERKQPARRAEPQQPAAAAFAPTPDPFPAATKAPAENAAGRPQVAASPPSAAQSAPTAAPAPTAPPAVSPAPPAPAWPLAKMRADSAADSGAAEARSKDRKPLPTGDWIALIRRLRAEDKTDEAAKELAAFRAAHPDHEKLLPPDLRDWRPAQK